SYTQLGMAALLPHQSLAFADDGLVEVDGNPSAGTENRSRILTSAGGTAIQTNDLFSMKRSETRELLKSHQLLYVYHNQIDNTGDKQATESDTFRACEVAIEELVRLVKKLANANVNNVLITADHGFLYQESRLERQDYLSVKPHGDTLLHVNHRFALGHSLKRDPAFITFSSQQLQMVGDIEAQVPASIHRIRTTGSGTRFVHGGASLQEVAVPVIAVNKGINQIRYVVERSIAHLKVWRILSTPCRLPRNTTIRAINVIRKIMFYQPPAEPYFPSN
ncbi:MAG: PglZ domain-containing protein, partial [Corynebacterium matruchotii]|uniref:PglZ domain-containing protein n=1 Tax=Corynebacterium matruchotii TaxID=43768 RepID=UPI00361A582D